MKKPYVRPVCISTVVALESPICTASIKVQSPNNKNGIENQIVNRDFEDANEFAPDSGWDLAS